MNTFKQLRVGSIGAALSFAALAAMAQAGSGGSRDMPPPSSGTNSPGTVSSGDKPAATGSMDRAKSGRKSVASTGKRANKAKTPSKGAPAASAAQ